MSKSASTGKVLKSFLLVFFAGALFVASSFGFAYARLQGNVDQSDISELLDENGNPLRDPKAGQDYNVLLLGSDVRGENDAPEYTEEGELIEGMRSDTAMLVHFAADRSHIEVVSIPRDTLVTIPSCSVRKQATSSSTFRTETESNAQFNWAFSRGGQTGDVASAAACTIRTLERLTNVNIDGYVVVNFHSFQDIVNALGGVPMYFEEEMEDSYSGLHVLKGCRLLDGTQALAFARARHNVGDGSGSDIGRIGRQQQLVSAMIDEILDMNLLTNSRQLYNTLDAGTKSLSTSQGLGDLTTLAGIAYSIRNTDLANFHFITMPFDWAGARVKMSKDAELVWKSIRRDEPVWVNEDGSINAPALQTASPSESASAVENPTAEEPAEAPTEEPTTEEPTPDNSGVETATPTETAPPECTKQNALRPNYD